MSIHALASLSQSLHLTHASAQNRAHRFQPSLSRMRRLVQTHAEHTEPSPANLTSPTKKLRPCIASRGPTAPSIRCVRRPARLPGTARRLLRDRASGGQLEDGRVGIAPSIAAHAGTPFFFFSSFLLTVFLACADDYAGWLAARMRTWHVACAVASGLEVYVCMYVCTRRGHKIYVTGTSLDVYTTLGPNLAAWLEVK